MKANRAKSVDEQETTGTQGANGPAVPPRVLVHCHAGVSRSATAVIAHLMRSWQCKYEIAEVYVRAKRNVIYPNSAFVRQLRALEPVLNDPNAIVAEATHSKHEITPQDRLHTAAHAQQEQVEGPVEASGAQGES